MNRLSILAIAIGFWIVTASGIRCVGQDRNELVKIGRPLVNAHAHNDYEHSRPLLDALENGFTSVEADIFLVDDQLLVAHDLKNTTKERTLERLYLKPLQKVVQQNKGSVFGNGNTLTLLVDIKANGAGTYRALELLLSKYSDIITETKDGRTIEKAVTVIISGERPWNEIAASNPRYAGIDGRLSDLDSDATSSLLPLISDNWTKHFQYRGQGEMESTERQKLLDILKKSHSKGRRVRFWATPESERLWTELKSAKVDLIGTDELQRLLQFLGNAAP